MKIGRDLRGAKKSLVHNANTTKQKHTAQKQEDCLGHPNKTATTRRPNFPDKHYAPAPPPISDVVPRRLHQ